MEECLLEEATFKISKSKPYLSRLSSRYLGLVIALIALFIASGSDALMKLIIDDIGGLEMIFAKNVFMTIVSVIIFRIKGDSIKRVSNKKHTILIIFSILRGLAPYIRCISYNYISLVDNTALRFTRLVFVSFLSCVFLKESFDAFDLSLIVFNIGGTILVCHPAIIFGSTISSEDSSIRLFGLMLVCLSSFINASHNCALRYVKDMPVSYIMILQSVFGVIEGGVALLVRIDEFVPITDWKTGGILISIILIGPIYLALETWAQQLLKSHEFSIAITSELVTAFVLQVIIFKVFPLPIETIGAAMIVLTIILVSVKEPITKKVYSVFAGKGENNIEI
ncbi:Solute carrier family 35 member G1 [Nymphon striatum]|nr:Solute carrier family 35 member G1 [Nymphon striatum]